MDYITKLESNFNKKFIETDVNKSEKKWNVISYVKMLEDMLKEKGISFSKELYFKNYNSVLIKDKNNIINKWVIEDETDTTYKIRFLDTVTEVYKKNCKIVDNTLYNLEVKNISEETLKKPLSFLVLCKAVEK